ncbi:2-phosphosulfolactate phosphatase [Sulfuritalea hydrogenivorans]|uniref:Probable 2-phosphosulfolactate phosphatase n=1 Tax=Sulfuritalea hydrogenivorans sk43H TaxID=1223802 RepID=W0SFS0_9PROT|nr:2-phosphosulfolactate phosphatase [Sulfuritalea hydrogenivorans]MDK9712805.1 2-phosphosulfolactate phosphatase [Sulfuritalea sp.]BAO30114.1 2-phosphosulfolactate phosphatase [Sulfuritalea hydrogenivorans sk43H]
MQKIHVLLKKEELDAQRLEGKVVVVLDILFATSSIVTALAHGASEVIPTLDGRAAQEAAKTFPEGSYVLSGELNADTLPGFVHPTPKALLAEGIAGRRLIYCTTNGTVALAKSKGAAYVYAAALLNGRAVVEHIVANHPESTILIVCSGSADNFNLEDFYGAGYLVSLFRHRAADADFSDAALAAELLHDHCDGLDALRRARVGRMMLARKLDEEVAFAAQESCYDVVPLLQDGVLRPI